VTSGLEACAIGGAKIFAHPHRMAARRHGLSRPLASPRSSTCAPTIPKDVIERCGQSAIALD